MLTFNHGSTYFSNKIGLTELIRVWRMVWDLIWGTYVKFLTSQKLKKLKEEESLPFGPTGSANNYNSPIYTSILHDITQK